MRRDRGPGAISIAFCTKSPFDPAGVYARPDEGGLRGGEYRYAIVELPPSPYARDLQEVLAFVFDIGVNLAGCTGEQGGSGVHGVGLG